MEGTATRPSIDIASVPLSASLRQTQYAPQSKRIPIHGCAGCFQSILASDGTPGLLNGPYGQVAHGTSLVLTTELRQNGPRAQGILTHSQATDSTSPWNSNMTSPFSKKHSVDLRFTARQLARDKGARRTHLPGAVAP